MVVLLTALIFAACSDAAPSAAPTPQATASSTATFSDEPSAPEVVQLEIPLEAPSEVPEELKAIWEAWALLVREHVDRENLDPVEATAEAIRGIVRTLNDPHTQYVAPEAFEIQNQDLQGEFEGIGASVSMRLDDFGISYGSVEEDGDDTQPVPALWMSRDSLRMRGAVACLMPSIRMPHENQRPR